MKPEKTQARDREILARERARERAQERIANARAANVRVPWPPTQLENAWARELLGKPWVANARGPETFDCYGLVWWVYQKILGIELPKFLGINATEITRVARQMHEGTQIAPWTRVDQPQHLDLVGMSCSHVVHHVGLYLDIDKGLILHVAAGKSVAAQTISHLKTLGMPNLRYYRHELRHNS